MLTLNHIAVAAGDLDKIRKLFQVMGLGVHASERVDDQGVNTHFIKLPAPRAQVELLEPVDPEGTVAKFIAKRGSGIHHLSFEVGLGELDALCSKIKAAGFELTYDKPKKGAHHMRINFIHPRSTGGLLIELMEPAST